MATRDLYGSDLGGGGLRRNRLVLVVLGCVVAAGLGGSVLANVVHSGDCSTFDDDVKSATELIHQGRFAAAADLLNLRLASSQRPVCPEVRTSVAQLAYSAAYEDLLQQSPGADLGQVASKRWREADARAHQNGAQPKSPMAVANDAYNAGAWLWAEAALQQASRDGLLPPSNFQGISLYYATLHNLGIALIGRHTKDAYAQGLSVLRTSCEISQAVPLSQWESCQYLASVFGSSRASWPAPVTDDPIVSILPRRPDQVTEP